MSPLFFESQCNLELQKEPTPFRGDNIAPELNSGILRMPWSQCIHVASAENVILLKTCLTTLLFMCKHVDVSCRPLTSFLASIVYSSEISRNVENMLFRYAHTGKTILCPLPSCSCVNLSYIMTYLNTDCW